MALKLSDFSSLESSFSFSIERQCFDPLASGHAVDGLGRAQLYPGDQPAVMARDQDVFSLRWDSDALRPLRNRHHHLTAWVRRIVNMHHARHVIRADEPFAIGGKPHPDQSAGFRIARYRALQGHAGQDLSACGIDLQEILPGVFRDINPSSTGRHRHPLGPVRHLGPAPHLAVDGVENNQVAFLAGDEYPGATWRHLADVGERRTQPPRADIKDIGKRERFGVQAAEFAGFLENTQSAPLASNTIACGPLKGLVEIRWVISWRSRSTTLMCFPESTKAPPANFPNSDTYARV